MNGAELLHEAGKRVQVGWCQGAEARGAGGGVVDVESKEAVSWSLLGALQAAALVDRQTQIRDIGAAVAAIAELITDPSLAHWNDEPVRTHGDVTTLLAEAESLARDGRVRLHSLLAS
jgi:hypothetical protein